LSASTLSGSVAPSLLHSPPSSRCGSPSRSTTSPALASSIASASKG
uniref:REJ domain-containing protein n=1 Tax=Taenia asiatica TaxID=60517 RepID=A0A0R3VYZ4_TAEAS